MVSLGGLEPPASSLSGIEGSALCGPPFPRLLASVRGEGMRSYRLVQPAPTPEKRGHGPTPTQTAAAGDPQPDRAVLVVNTRMGEQQRPAPFTGG
jgi:hypothetical protein